MFLISFCVVLILMEVFARLLHEYIWHGPLWFIHRSHHEESEGFFEANDIFAVFYGVLSMGMIAYGSEYSVPLCSGIGAAIAVFGIAYLLVHDGYMHDRLPMSFLGRISFFRKLKAMHILHHRKNQAPYGLFWAPRPKRRKSK